MKRVIFVLLIVVFFAGVTTSHAQLSGNVQLYLSSSTYSLLRAQGVAEAVGDIPLAGYGTINNGSTPASFSVAVTYDGPITNAALSPGGSLGSGGTLSAPSASGISVTVNPTYVTFTGASWTWAASAKTLTITFNLAGGGYVTFAQPPAGGLITIHGVRVNVTAVNNGISNYVAATFSGAPSSNIGIAGSATVGWVSPGLGSGTGVLPASPGSTTYYSGSTSYSFTPAASFTNCGFSPPPTSPASITSQSLNSYTTLGIRVAEGYMGGFTTQAQEVAKTGSEVKWGTRIEIDFTGVPSQLSLGVPQVVATSSSNPTLVLTLVTTSPTAGYGEFRAPLSGTVSFIYEVTTAVPLVGASSIMIPVWVRSNGLSSAGSFGASIQLAPVSTTATDIPRFIGSPISGGSATISACVTRLLFPFVTNKAGFDTGVAIMNTGQDDKGTSTQSGTCAVTYWDGTTVGTTPLKTTTTPSLGPGQSISFLASDSTMGAPGFQGYVFANCNFQYAHGIAFVVNGFGALAAPTIGSFYQALVTSDVRSVGSGVEALNN